MPKTAEIKLYRYRELEGITGRTIGRNVPQEAAKHNVGDHWYEQMHDDERDVARFHLDNAGLPMADLEMAIDTSCCQGSGMSITGRFDLSDADECEPLVDIATDYPQFNPEQLRVMITRRDSHYVHSRTMSVEVEFTGDGIMVDLETLDIDELVEAGQFEALVDEPLQKMGDRIFEALVVLCDEAHQKAEDCALSDSDGYINDWMDEMGYWFDEDGQIIERDNN